jgi:hypothetical protein
MPWRECLPSVAINSPDDFVLLNVAMTASRTATADSHAVLQRYLALQAFWDNFVHGLRRTSAAAFADVVRAVEDCRSNLLGRHRSLSLSFSLDTLEVPRLRLREAESHST